VSEPKGEGISLLVPFKSHKGDHRMKVWEWLKAYWESALPGAEIVMGVSESPMFCKTAAVNYAARRATGDIFVIMDADCYMCEEDVLDAAKLIRESRWPLWLVPYRRFYRFTEDYTMQILETNPQDPLSIPYPPSEDLVGNRERAAFGHWFGALIQMMPREAFETVGGMDERFAGWGGEDVSFARALDTLYARHKTTPNPVYHLWHSSIGATYQTRLWVGQHNPMANDRLSIEYDHTFGDPVKMRKLVDGGFPRKVFPHLYWDEEQ
jgi:hypothetical protein